jgi:O-succinylbenzoic acid--CoA ligase
MAEPLINWTDDTSHVLINRLLPHASRYLLEEAVKPHVHLQGHLWVASSGTESFPKMIALSKQAMLSSARAVNQHLSMTLQDRWLNVLPLFHVGGLGVHARAFLSESPVFDFSKEKWLPENYVNRLNEFGISHSSLTPTHVYDLVLRCLSAPKTLKAIIVGGGVLSKELHERAFALGWPLLTSYGMTEMGSQIATAKEPFPNAPLEILPHVEVKFNDDGFMVVKSEALLTGFVHGDDLQRRFIDPKVNGWYTTQDRGEMVDNGLKVHGRGANFMKIGGENISFTELENIWGALKISQNYDDEAVLIDLPDDRLGRIVCVAVKKAKNHHDQRLHVLMNAYHQKVMPLAKIRHVYYMEKIPQTDLYKLKKDELRQLIMHPSK